ncbi:MAG TPA: hypothetical protein VIH48_00345 [Candidatus Bathyarchaeia archaeon]
MGSKNFWSRIQRISGWLTLLLLVVSIVSGYGWDIRTSDFVSNLTAGLLNRALAADIHSFVIFALLITLLFHIVPSVGRLFAKKKQD